MPATSQQGPATGVSVSGSACGRGRGVGVPATASSTSTSTSTGTSTATGSLTWKRPDKLISSISSGSSCVSHSPSTGRVLRKIAPSEIRRQTPTSTVAVVSIVRVAANAPSAPPMAMAAIRAAMIARFIADQAYARGQVARGYWPHRRTDHRPPITAPATGPRTRGRRRHGRSPWARGSLGSRRRRPLSPLAGAGSARLLRTS